MNANTSLPISVVIPCYRCIDSIDAALDSALSQTQSATEIWLIDDCSGDGTLEHLHQLQRRHPDLVRVLSLPSNSGPGPARNAGWMAATQPWLAFLDADDVWHPQKLEAHWNWLKKHPEVVLCGHQTRMLAENDLTSLPSSFTANKVTLVEMLRSNRFATRTVMVRRDVPFRFEGKAFSEDYLLWLQIVAAGMPAYNLSVCLAYSLGPEYSPGGLSGNLWQHEKGELRSLWTLFQQRKISSLQWTSAAGWSLTKFSRRMLLRLLTR